MNDNKTQIVEVQAGEPIPALDAAAPVLIHGDRNVAATCARLHSDDVPCSRIAFVSKLGRRSRRRFVAGVGLSQQYGRPCRVFTDADAARRWLLRVS